MKAKEAFLAIFSRGLLACPGQCLTADYTDPASCQPCHAQIYESYLKTPMGRSFKVAERDAAIEDWTVKNRFYHAPSESYFEMTKRGTDSIVRRYQLDESGLQVNVFELGVTHIIGSGERAKSYLHQTPQGRLVELPVSWYSQEEKWGMAPGYDRPKHPGFTRTVNHKCMFCHNAYPSVTPEKARQGWDHDVRFPSKLPAGIDCQRCHGPGGQHIQAASVGQSTSQVRLSIINPGRLTPEKQLDICMQCHLETTTFRLPDSYRRFGQGFYSFRPGEALSDYIIHFDHAPGTGHDDKFEIVSAAYRLRQSLCFVKSEGRLTCTTCHNPHQTVPPEKAATHYREQCFACHSSRDATRHKSLAGDFGRSGCAGCHMPKRRTEDVVHVVMTDHRIQRRTPARDLLAPMREKTDEEQIYRGEVVLYYPKAGLDGLLRQIYLGIAQVKEKVNLKQGAAMLEQAVLQTSLPHPEPYFELAEAQLALGRKGAAVKAYHQVLERDPEFVQAEHHLGNLLAGLGETEKALKHYRRAVELDPGFADVYLNLGLTLRSMGDLLGTESAFRQAIAADPFHAAAHRDLGSLLLVQGKIEAAKALFERSLAIEPADAKTHNNLGLALLASGQQKEAMAHLKFSLRYGTESDRELTLKTLRKVGIEIPQ
jgi:Tfp pilus assembly protein PilF